MKKITIFLVLGVLLFTYSFRSRSMKQFDSGCDVAKIYEAITPDYGVKAINIYGEVEDISEILVPTEIEEGVYEVQITRKSDDLYKIENTSYYIETRFCYEYATFSDAILKVNNVNGYSIGKVFFD